MEKIFETEGNSIQQTCGIYKIENLINHKVYIGQSVNIKRRWREHQYYAQNSEQKPEHLYLSMAYYGIENFSFEVIEYCSQKDLDSREIYWISYYQSTDREKGYNIETGGKQGTIFYNYEEIYNEWKNGKSCQQLEKEFSCGDCVITSALRYFNIDDFTVRSRAAKKNQIVALSKDHIPLKIFNSVKEAGRFLKISEKCADSIYNAITNKRMSYGYYWEKLTENNQPNQQLSDEEFFSYQKIKRHYSQEERLKMSKKRRTITRPGRDKLKQLIRTMPFTIIGKMYGVSDNAIRKWCDFEKLPRTKKEINSYSDEEWELI